MGVRKIYSTPEGVIVMIKSSAKFVYVLLWLKLAVSPALISLSIAAFISIESDEVNLYLIVTLALIGLVVGVAWAERIRRTIGLSAFHGRLIAHPEIDGNKSK